jgi:ribosomal protein S12 methylthiotransferase
MKFYIKKLGCPKNDVDADYIAGQLIQRGHDISQSPLEAEVVIVNSCGFILPAKEESIEEILHFGALKKSGRIGRLFVTGCLAQRYGGELYREIPEVDGFFGLGKINELATAFENDLDKRIDVSGTDPARLDYLAGSVRYVEEKYPYDYLKIADGCDRFCSYCAIPFIRGPYRCRKISDIFAEAEFLVSKGKKELILVSQEGSAYGKDLGDGINAVMLLSALEKVDGLKWIRLMYLHPGSLTDELIDYMTSSEKVLSYFDIPLQHISDRLLRRMNRPVNRAEIERKLIRIKKLAADNIIRTTFISGLPGETETEFEELCRFISEFEFDRLGVFQFSKEEGTKAATMTGQVSAEIAESRMDRLMTIQQKIAFEKNIALIGKIQEVIIDEQPSGKVAVARGQGDCPEIDQTVYVHGDGLKGGDIVKVRVTMAEGYDLIAGVESEGL